MNDKNSNNDSDTKWSRFSRSPLAMFAGIFSLLETVGIGILSQVDKFKAIDGVMLLLLTVNMFVLIVLARPQALYPPNEWKEPTPAPEARIALWALVIFIFFIGLTWALDRGGDELAKIIHGS